jgi:hypothetical protein
VDLEMLGEVLKAFAHLANTTLMLGASAYFTIAVKNIGR